MQSSANLFALVTSYNIGRDARVKPLCEFKHLINANRKLVWDKVLDTISAMYANNIYSFDGANAQNWQFDPKYLAPQYVAVEKLTQCVGRIKHQGLYSIGFNGGSYSSLFHETGDVYGQALLMAFVLECTPDAVNDPHQQLFPQDEWGRLRPVDFDFIIMRYKYAYGKPIADEVEDLIRPRFKPPNTNKKVEVQMALSKLIEIVERGEKTRDEESRKRREKRGIQFAGDVKKE